MRSIAKKPNLFRFVGRLQFFDGKKSNDMALVADSKTSQSQSNSGNAKYQNRNKKIKELTEMIDEGRIGVREFLETIASHEYRMLC